MKTKTLLEKARMTAVRQSQADRIGAEDEELVLAWAKGEITTTQMGKASGFVRNDGCLNAQGTYLYGLRVLRHMVMTGKLVEAKRNG